MGNSLNIQAWSKTAASNSNADSGIGTISDATNADAVDDIERGQMAAIAKYVDDTDGGLTDSGTANALVVTTNQSLSSGHLTDGLRIGVWAANANTSTTVNINVDGLGNKRIKDAQGNDPAVGAIAAGMFLDLCYEAGNGQFHAANLSGATVTRASLGLATSDSPQFAGVNVGHASDTTLTRLAAGVLGVEGNRMARIFTGSYTGDGSTSKAITGVGFTPKMVVIAERATSNNASVDVFMTTDTIIDDNAAGGAIELTSASLNFHTNRIIAFGSDGFTVDDDGGDENPNKSGTVYNFIAFG